MSLVLWNNFYRREWVYLPAATLIVVKYKLNTSCILYQAVVNVVFTKKCMEMFLMAVCSQIILSDS